MATVRTRSPAHAKATRAAKNSGTRELETGPVGQSSHADEIYAAVRAIPPGKVATYGQLAELAGIARGHRIVARAMRSCPKGLPWQRVVGKKDARRAQISVQEEDHAALQRRLLEAEGVRFDASGFIVLSRFGWLPR
jgi:methylated-DNA-protein-cysteine methyltransferase-like protein